MTGITSIWLNLNSFSGIHSSQELLFFNYTLLVQLTMPQLIDNPTRIEAVGNKPKQIDEYIGRITSHTEMVSITQMRSPGGWADLKVTLSTDRAF